MDIKEVAINKTTRVDDKHGKTFSTLVPKTWQLRLKANMRPKTRKVAAQKWRMKPMQIMKSRQVNMMSWISTTCGSNQVGPPGPQTKEQENEVLPSLQYPDRLDCWRSSTGVHQWQRFELHTRTHRVYEPLVRNTWASLVRRGLTFPRLMHKTKKWKLREQTENILSSKTMDPLSVFFPSFYSSMRERVDTTSGY